MDKLCELGPETSIRHKVFQYDSNDYEGGKHKKQTIVFHKLNRDQL